MTDTQSAPMGGQELIALDPAGLAAAVRECAKITAPEITDDEFNRLKARNDSRYTNSEQEMGRAIRAYLSAAASPRLADKWQPISAAPRDGRMALVYRPLARNSGDEPIAVKRLVKGNQHCWDSTVPPGAEPFNPTDGSCHVTHWQPLEPPSEVASSNCNGDENA